MMSYTEFYKRQEELHGCSYRIVGELNGKIVKSCWRKNLWHDLAEKPNGENLKILGIEIA